MRTAICSNTFFLLLAQTVVYFSVLQSYFTSSGNSNEEAKENMVFWSGCVCALTVYVNTTLILSAKAEAAKIKETLSSSPCLHLALNISSSFRKITAFAFRSQLHLWGRQLQTEIRWWRRLQLHSKLVQMWKQLCLPISASLTCYTEIIWINEQ